MHAIPPRSVDGKLLNMHLKRVETATAFKGASLYKSEWPALKQSGT